MVEVLECRRLLAAGQLDPTFGAGGTVQGYQQLFAGGQCKAALVQPDGRVILAGGTGSDQTNPPSPASDFALVRFTKTGQLDPSFGSGGRVSQAGPATFATVDAMALQADGKIVAAGYSGGSFVVARFNPDGTFDPGFGSGGVVVTAFHGFDQANAIAIQPDGKLVVAGSTSGGSGTEVAVARYLPSGSLDPTFGAGGEVIWDAQSNGAVGVALSRNGKVVVAGDDGQQIILSRFTATGAPDLSFGKHGNVAAAPKANSQYTVAGVALTPDGKVIVGGSVVPPGNNGGYALETGMMVARFTANGKVDRSFGTSGSTIVKLPDVSSGTSADAAHNANGVGAAMALQKDGRIVLAGSVYLIGLDSRESTPSRFAAVRFTASGSVDPTFGSGGKAQTGTDNIWPTDVNGANAVAIGPDGRIVLAGTTSASQFATDAVPDDFAAIRYTSAGRLDNSFGLLGHVGTTPNCIEGDPRAAVLQPDGKLVVVSSSFNATATISRFLPDASPDPSFGTDGRVFSDADFARQTGINTTVDVTGVALLGNGEILTVAEVNLPSNDYSKGGIQLELYRADGIRDPHFGNGGIVTMYLGKGQPTVFTKNVVVQPDGKIVVPIQMWSTGATELLRFNHNGSLDQSFGRHGITALTAFGASAALDQAIVQPDGIVLVGADHSVTSPGAVAVVERDLQFAQVLPDGTMNTSFGTLGLFDIPLPASSAIEPAYQVVTSGALLVGVADQQTAAIWRFAAVGGPPDGAFGTNGQLSLAMPAGCTAQKVDFMADGSVLVEGGQGASSQPALAHFTASGALDRSWGNVGLTLFPYNTSPLTVLPSSDGKVFVLTHSQMFRVDGGT